LVESFSKSTLIDEVDIKLLRNTLNNYSMKFIEHEKNGLQSAMFSYGFKNTDSIFINLVKKFENQLNRILLNARDLLELAIIGHNENIKQASPRIEQSSRLLTNRTDNLIASVKIC
jgi:hypothetical protein